MMNELSPETIFANARIGKPGCLFCDPVEGMIFHETEHFTVLLDTFPVLPGHLMISTKEHYGCAGEVPSDWVPELLELKSRLRKEVEGLHGHAIFYEHGRAGCCLAANPDGSKCEHFHLHCLPADIPLPSRLTEDYDEITPSSYSELQRLFQEEGHYLYFEDAKGQMSFFPAEDDKVESHLLRTLVCQALRVEKRSEWEKYDEATPFIHSHDLIHQEISFAPQEATSDLLR